MSHSANKQPNPDPAAHPLASPVGENEERAGRAAPAPGRDTRATRGVPQLRFNSWHREEEAAAQEGSQGSSRLGNREGWSCEERGAHWTERGGQDWQERGTLGAKARPLRQQGDVGGREGARMQDLGREGRKDGSKSWGRRAPRGVEDAGRRAWQQERGKLRADVQEGSAWRSSSGLGALDPKRPTRVGVVRSEEGRARKSNHREKQMEGETCAPAGGRGTGRRVRAGTRGGAGKPRPPRGGGAGVTGGRRPHPSQAGPGWGARAGALEDRSLRALPRARTLTF